MTEVDPVAVMDAAQKINLSGLGIGMRGQTLSEALSGMSGMAGTDTAAQSFAHAYDPAAKGLLDAIGKLGKGTANIGLVLGASALNHNDANAAAARKPPPDIGSVPGQSTYTMSGLPNSSGNASPGPWWWQMIAAYVQGKVWPNGHQDQLRKSADAWDDFAGGITNDAEGFYQGLQKLKDQDSEDIDAGLIMSDDAYQNVFTVAHNAKTLAGVCRDQAQHIDDAHSEIENAVAEILVETALIWAAGALLTAPTIGGSDVLAGGVSGAQLARVGAAVARIVEGFEGAALATAGGASGANGAAVATAMSRAVGLPVTRIAAAGVSGGNAARLTAQEQAELTRVANQTDYQKYLASKLREGKPPRSFDDYIKARDSWAARKLQGTERENFIAREKGFTEENGWRPQQLAPNGKGRGEEGSRIWDFANAKDRQAVEVKSGQTKEADFSRQLAIDEGFVMNKNWEITYYLKEPLNPSQMGRLAELEARAGGRFTVSVQ